MRHGGLILAAALLLAGGPDAGAEPTARERPPARCIFLADEHILAVTIKLTATGSRDGQGYVARSGDRIDVFGGPDAEPVSCVGGVPTITNTDFVLVRAGNRVKEPELAVDMRRGILGPGFTDERDGTSEVEVFADVGQRGSIVVASTSGPDQVTVGPGEEGDVVNVNAAEAVADADVFAPRGSLHVYGAAGADQITATAAPSASGQDSAGAILLGGGGSDLLVGSEATDLVQGDGGADLLVARGSNDIVLGLDRARDQIDCGAGNDTFVIVDRADELAGCEKREFEEPFADFRPQANRFRVGWPLVRSPFSPTMERTMSSPASAGR